MMTIMKNATKANGAAVGCLRWKTKAMSTAVKPLATSDLPSAPVHRPLPSSAAAVAPVAYLTGGSHCLSGRRYYHHLRHRRDRKLIPHQSPFWSYWQQQQLQHLQRHRRKYTSSSHVQNWWNPFSTRGVRNSNAAIGSVWSPQHGGEVSSSPSSPLSSEGPDINDEDHPRRIQERKDLTLLLLAVTFRKQVMAERQQISSSSSSTSTISLATSPAAMDRNTKREQLIDRSFAIIQDEIQVDTISVSKLRQVLQSELEPQVIELFKAFQQIDASHNITSSEEDDQQQLMKKNDLVYNEILHKELKHTENQLKQWHDYQHNHQQEDEVPLKAPKGADPSQFLSLKLGALETLLDRRLSYDPSQHDVHRQILDEEQAENSSKSTTTATTSPSWVDADEFGFHESPIDPQRNRLIRYYQTINVCRNRELRSKIGYSVLALQSSIPGAGRGVYVDGYAPAGSILCFQPGLVWLKDHLLNCSIEEDRELTRNDAYQMSLRADDIIIDSRQSPYTVLTDDSSNMMAVGHIVNHPTTTRPPNARSAMLDFTSSMFTNANTHRDDDCDYDTKTDIRRYIPNTYAKPPISSSRGGSGFIQSLMNNRGNDEMHSMVLIATRDICNEEIFYDYRLATSHLPSWYEPVIDSAFVNDDYEEQDYQK